MYFSWGKSGSVLAVLLGTAMCATPQSYTISARPGAVNYIEGTAMLNGHSIFTTTHSTPFLKAGDTLSTLEGKTEVLLTPGIFLRVGANSAIHAKSMALTDVNLELQRGEAMIEVDNLMPDNEIRITSQGATIQMLKPGLYRFTAGPSASAATINGKALILFDDKKVELSSGHEVLLEAGLPKKKFDKKQPDDLYAWSNVRSQYEAAASLQSARSMPVDSSSSSLSSYPSAMGYGPYGMSGWAWNGLFNSYAWVPGGDLAFFNPFGYGFFAPGVVQYAPVYYLRQNWGGAWNGGVGTVPVAVNPNNPPAFHTTTSSVAANQAARSAAMRTYMSSGFTTPGGHQVAAGNVLGSTPTAGSSHWNGASISHASSASAGHAGGVNGGGYSAGHAGGLSGASSAGHSAGGVGAGGGGHH
jgi:hypothetical protein